VYILLQSVIMVEDNRDIDSRYAASNGFIKSHTTFEERRF
jgi:hypothetical protein